MALRSLNTRTFVSHSSLSASERKLAETAFAEEQDCVIVATSTLELGIDVGDLDYVIQIDSPSTVSSFLQRMGRSGRRAGSRRNCLFLTTTDEAFLLACAITTLWREKYVEHIKPPPLPWHIVAQQMLALVLEYPGHSARRLWPWREHNSPTSIRRPWRPCSTSWKPGAPVRQQRPRVDGSRRRKAVRT